jgi:hypothetical protein
MKLDIFELSKSDLARVLYSRKELAHLYREEIKQQATAARKTIGLTSP